MKFKRYCVPTILLCVLLANEFKQTDSGDVGKEVFADAIPLVAGVIGMMATEPIAPFVATAFGILQLATKALLADKEDSLSKKDFLESQAIIAYAIKNVDLHMEKAVKQLSHVIQSHEMFEDMRNDLDTLSQAFFKNMKVILNPHITGITKQTRMNAMLDYFSSFRQILRSFVSKYIKPKGVISATGQVKLFFDLILSKEHTEIEFGDYCHSESTHTQLFKSYIYILKTLTDAYVMAISAHTVQYQIELKKDNNTSDAIEIQNFGLDLVNDYLTDMKAFMEKTKWALDTSSREIQNCGTFEWKRGETFESLSFAHILPKLKQAITIWPSYICYPVEPDINVTDYEIFGKCTHGGLNKFIEVEVYTNLSNPNWPYLYLKSDQNEGSKYFFGHKKTGPGIIKTEMSFSISCAPLFCPAFKKKAVAISTQIVRAKPEYVITGVRLRMRKNVMYIDIQQGKMLNDLSVDPKTVTWTESPKSKNIIYLSPKIRKFELGDAELKENQYLTSIQLKLKNKVDGIIGFSIGGGNASNWNTSELIGSSYIEKSNELVLSEKDSPEQYGAGGKNMISKAPVPSKPYYVTFQATDLKKDFGITTIPYIDIREVFSYPPAPLAGFGMYHQTVKDSGGFISVKLITPNFSRFIDSKMIEAIKITT